MPFFFFGGGVKFWKSLSKHNTERKECMIRDTLRGGVGLKIREVLDLNSRIVCKNIF